MIINVLDQELPMLASDAAVELDLLLNGVNVQADSVRLLAEKLQSMLPTDSVDSTPHSLQTDTALQNVLGLAFARTGDDPQTILQHLLVRTADTAKKLSNANQQVEQPVLEWQRAFCLALSQSAASHRQMLYGMRPSHPDRR